MEKNGVLDDQNCDVIESQPHFSVGLTAMLRFARSEEQITGYLTTHGSRVTTLNLHVPIYRPVFSLPASFADLQFVANRARYRAEVEVEIQSSTLLRLDLLQLPQRYERQREPRKPSDLKVYYRRSRVGMAPNAWLTARVVDAGDEGMGILIPRALFPGESIEISLPSAETSAEDQPTAGEIRPITRAIPARVAYCHAAPGGAWRVGINLHSLTSTEQEVYRSLYLIERRPPEKNTSKDRGAEPP